MGFYFGMCWVNWVDFKGFGNGFLFEGRFRGYLMCWLLVCNFEMKMKLMYKCNIMGFFF